MEHKTVRELRTARAGKASENCKFPGLAGKIKLFNLYTVSLYAIMGAAEEPTGRFGRNRKGNVVLSQQEVRLQPILMHAIMLSAFYIAINAT